MPPSFTASLILKGRDQASAAVKATTSSFGKLTSFLASKFVFTAQDVFRAVGAISDALNKSTEEAIKAEQATRLLDVALAQAGDSTLKTKEASEAWTKQLQSQTTTSQEAIKEAAALALQFGIGTDDLEKFTRTALDFAGAADIGFTEAVRRMGRALSGSVEDISKFNPAINDLTKAQLRAGEATNLLAEAVGGTAAALADTYEGAVDGVTTSWREFNKAVGENITQDPEIREALQEQARVIDLLTLAATGGESSISKLSAAWTRAKTVAIGLTQVLLSTVDSLFGAKVGWDAVTTATEGATAATQANTKAAGLNAAQLTAQSQATEALKDELRALGIVLDEDLNDAIEKDTQLIEDAQDAWSRGEIELEELVEAEEKFGLRIRENKDALEGHTIAQDDGTRAFVEFTEEAFAATGAVDGYSLSLERARGDLVDLQRQQAGGVPRASTAQVGGIGSRDSGLFPGISGTSFTVDFDNSEEADDFVRRVNRQSRGG